MSNWIQKDCRKSKDFARLRSTLAANVANWEPIPNDRLLVSSSRQMICSTGDLTSISKEQIEKSRALMMRSNVGRSQLISA